MDTSEHLCSEAPTEPAGETSPEYSPHAFRLWIGFWCQNPMLVNLKDKYIAFSFGYSYLLKITIETVIVTVTTTVSFISVIYKTDRSLSVGAVESDNNIPFIEAVIIKAV